MGVSHMWVSHMWVCNTCCGCVTHVVGVSHMWVCHTCCGCVTHVVGVSHMLWVCTFLIFQNLIESLNKFMTLEYPGKGFPVS